MLDHDYNPIGLNKLTEESQRWLLLITYSYLSAIKNPSRENIRIVTELKHGNGGARFVETGVVTSETEYISSKPHLRVLHIAQKAQKMLQPEVEEETRFQFGISLRELNQAFLLVQQNRRLLAELNSPVKELIETAISRVMERPEKPAWLIQSNPEVGETEMLILTNPPIGYDPNTYVYMITLVEEPKVLANKPVSVNCPGIGTQLAELLQGEFVF